MSDVKPTGLLPEDGRNADVPMSFAGLKAQLKEATGNGADLTDFAGSVLEQPIGWCTHNAVMAACTSLRAGGGNLPWDPSQKFTYQTALRLDRATENPGKKPEDMPPLRDVGSRLLTVVRVMQDYGITKMEDRVTVDGYTYNSDCGPADLDEDQYFLDNVIRARKRLIVGAYEIFGDYKPQMVQALEAGRSCAIAGMVDLPFMRYNGGIFHKIDYSQAQGGHAMEVVGYKYVNGVRLWKIKNSWGVSWGASGFAWVTDDFIDQLWSVYVMDCYLEPA